MVKVVGREHATVVGIFHYGTRNNHVTPLDEKISQEIVIPRGAEKIITTEDAEDENRKKQRHRVIGKEARQRTQFGDLDGVVVDVEITDWPTPTQNARGRVIEILGYEDDFGVDVEIIIRKHHLPHRFPPEVITVAVRWYLRYSLSYRDLEEMMTERGLSVDHVTIWRWVQHYAPILNQRLRREMRRPNRFWRVDETYIKVAASWSYPYRAVDSAGWIITRRSPPHS